MFGRFCYVYCFLISTPTAQPRFEFGTISNFVIIAGTSNYIVLHLLHLFHIIMSIDRELQFLAMLEGHELEKELLDIVSIIISFIVSFLKKTCLSAKFGLW